MDTQRIARTTGWLFLATFATAITARGLFAAVWDDPGYLAGPSDDIRIWIGALFEVLLVVTNIGTALVLYPLLKRQSESGALGYVAARIMESAVIMVGLLSIVSLVSVRNDLAAANADPASIGATASSLIATYDMAFLFGPGLVVGFGNGILLGYLMYRSGLVPRGLAMLGIVGGPLLIVAFVGLLFGVIEANSPAQLLLSAAEIAWEFGLGVYLIVKGFRPSPLTAADARA